MRVTPGPHAGGVSSHSGVRQEAPAPVCDHCDRPSYTVPLCMRCGLPVVAIPETVDEMLALWASG